MCLISLSGTNSLQSYGAAEVIGVMWLWCWENVLEAAEQRERGKLHVGDVCSGEPEKQHPRHWDSGKLSKQNLTELYRENDSIGLLTYL